MRLAVEESRVVLSFRVSYEGRAFRELGDHAVLLQHPPELLLREDGAL